MRQRRIIFYYESKNIGGAQLLLARLAEYLEQKGQVVGYICSEDGFLKQYLGKNKNIEFIDIKKIQNHNISKEDVIVAPLSYIEKTIEMNQLNDLVRLFYWDMHPYNYIEYMAFSYFYKKQNILVPLLKFIERSSIKQHSKNLKFLQQGKSLGFMCKKNLEYNKTFFSADIQSNYLPICLDVPAFIERSKALSQYDTISVGWISRLDLDKVILLNDLILSLTSLIKRKSYSIKLFVIGDGEAIGSIVKSTNLDVEFVGKISGSKLDTFIVNNVDCGFSVGTSALEFAKLSIPTFLCPGSDSFKNYRGETSKYLALHKSYEYDVAVEEYHQSKAISIDACFTLMLDSYLELSVSSYNYVLSNHSTKFSSELLLEYFSTAKVNLQSLRRNFTRSRSANLLKQMKCFVKRLKI